MKIKNLEIKELLDDNCVELYKLLISEDISYSKYFIPFPFELKVIETIFRNRKKDKYFGIFIQKLLIGFFMLRGFDEGYDIPSYGVWISKEFSNKGISKLTLFYSVSFCKINNISKLMLKVHPQNSIAKRTYENFGFVKAGIDPINANIIYNKEIK